MNLFNLAVPTVIDLADLDPRRYDWRRLIRVLLIVFAVAILPGLKAALDSAYHTPITTLGALWELLRGLALHLAAAGASAVLAALVAYFVDPRRRAELDGYDARYDFKKLGRLLGGVFLVAAWPVISTSWRGLFNRGGTPREYLFALLQAVAAGASAMIAATFVYFVDPKRRAEITLPEPVAPAADVAGDADPTA